MSALVDDLLVLARTDAGIEKRRGTTCDLTEIASEIKREVEALANKRSVHLCIKMPDEPLIVQGDSGWLRRLLLILLDNAVKYSSPGGEVRLRISVAPNIDIGDGAITSVIEVSDTGIGLDPAEMPRLFERFYRGVRARQHAPGGSGLGLAIARTIVDWYHGSMTLAAAGERNGRQGCRVQVVLPLDRVSLGKVRTPRRFVATRA